MILETAASLAPAPPGADEALQEEVRTLRERFARLWLDTGCEPPGAAELGPELSRWAQWRNRRRADRLVRRLCRAALRAPAEEAARRAWRAGLKAEVSAFGEACLGWPASWREAPLAEEIFEASGDFVRRARELSHRSGIGLARSDLFQALRNVWILNGLQVLLGRPVAVTPSVFAYSMLYPLTDNFLDDPEVAPAAKAAFNRRLGRRLAGERPAAGDRLEEVVFDLVGEIEGEYPRAFHPRVFASLLAIHRGQVRSLRQQAPAAAGTAPDLLRVSCEKGGTSVLADGFLVAGDLTSREAEFLFGYGVALQLLDDLQDAAEDRAAGHRTLFSVAAGRPPLDELTSRLARFTRRVLAPAEGFEAPGWEVVAGLMRGNCPLLLLQAVADQRRLFTPGYVRRLEGRFPVPFGALPRLRRRARRRWRRTERVLRRTKGDDSQLGLVEPA